MFHIQIWYLGQIGCKYLVIIECLLTISIHVLHSLYFPSRLHLPISDIVIDRHHDSLIIVKAENQTTTCNLKRNNFDEDHTLHLVEHSFSLIQVENELIKYSFGIKNKKTDVCEIKQFQNFIQLQDSFVRYLNPLHLTLLIYNPPATVPKSISQIWRSQLSLKPIKLSESNNRITQKVIISRKVFL